MSYHRLSCNRCHGLFPASCFSPKRRVCPECRRTQVAAAQRSYKARKKAGLLPPPREQASACIVAGTPSEQAMAVCSAEGTVDVYRFASGAITWRRAGGNVANAEFVGRYDHGADYRRVVEDLTVGMEGRLNANPQSNALEIDPWRDAA